MSHSVIKAEHISKKYKIGQKQSNPTLRDAITNIGNIFKAKAPTEEFWALKDVSFEINEGDVVGIIGRNGSGKSTLLKILSRITEPTEGKITLKGRVASLLEVGTGFNPELTGRENIFLNGSILGMTKAEIRKHFDEIVDFSGVEKFLDTPVKRYSSGMYVRLAFAVAAHLESEILLVDEVLAVGDAEFQKKCLGKMGSLAKSGRTVIYVSHNMISVKKMCNKALHLDSGKIINTGTPVNVVNDYLKLHNNPDKLNWVNKDGVGNEYLKLIKASVCQGKSDNKLLSIENPIHIQLILNCLKPLGNFNISMSLLTDEQQLIFTTISDRYDLKPGQQKLECIIPAKFFNDETYIVNIMMVSNSQLVGFTEECLTFHMQEIKKRAGAWNGKWPGLIRPYFSWELNSYDQK